MSDNITKLIGGEKLPSFLKDPFKKRKITSIMVKFSDFWNNGNWKANGTVEFQNEDTKGEQNFAGESFDEVVLKIKSFINNELK